MDERTSFFGNARSLFIALATLGLLASLSAVKAQGIPKATPEEVACRRSDSRASVSIGCARKWRRRRSPARSSWSRAEARSPTSTSSDSAAPTTRQR